MEKADLIHYMNELNDELRSQGITGEICIYGGAAMCLAYEARPATKDVDAIFQPVEKLREAARKLARKYHLREDWLNECGQRVCRHASVQNSFRFFSLEGVRS